MSVRLTSFETLCEVGDGKILVGKARAALMIQPAELLQNLGMIRAIIEDPLVSVLGCAVLHKAKQRSVGRIESRDSLVLLTSFCCS